MRGSGPNLEGYDADRTVTMYANEGKGVEHNPVPMDPDHVTRFANPGARDGVGMMSAPSLDFIGRMRNDEALRKRVLPNLPADYVAAYMPEFVIEQDEAAEEEVSDALAPSGRRIRRRRPDRTRSEPPAGVRPRATDAPAYQDTEDAGDDGEPLGGPSQ